LNYRANGLLLIVKNVLTLHLCEFNCVFFIYRPALQLSFAPCYSNLCYLFSGET